MSGDDDRMEGVDEKEKMEEETKEEVGVEVEGERSLDDDLNDNDKAVLEVESQGNFLLEEEKKLEFKEDQNVVLEKVEHF